MKRIGIFGGTFNPPHIGHLILAETAADNLELDCVYFVPAAEPPHKVGMPRAPVEDRVKMVEASIAGNQRFRLSRKDVDRPGPHYAVDMLQLFHDEYPEADLFFLMGSDSLRDLLAWHQPERIIEMTQLVVMQRPAIYPDLASLTKELPALLSRLYFLNAPEIEVSSTQIVHLLKDKRSVRYLVVPDVLSYIIEHELYTNHRQ
ncbi:MAG: nicotinate-nucleotide adenylyltransferase [Chloroflexi bacterium]|nr:nicotinate-nucleotide adenylyltransferase [Chloroflexota bacterium]